MTLVSTTGQNLTPSKKANIRKPIAFGSQINQLQFLFNNRQTEEIGILQRYLNSIHKPTFEELLSNDTKDKQFGREKNLKEIFGTQDLSIKICGH